MRRLCRCGQAFDERGMCPHCDARPAISSTSALYDRCVSNCTACAQYARYCPVCRTDRGTRTAAIQHERACRLAEKARGTGPTT